MGRVGFGGEDDERADVIGAFSHQGCDCVVDEHAWLEGDKHEVADWFLVCQAFRDGLVAAVDAVEHHVVCVFRVDVACGSGEGAGGAAVGGGVVY